MITALLQMHWLVFFQKKEMRSRQHTTAKPPSHYYKPTPPDVVLTDLKMEPVDGMAVLRAARACRPPLEVIVFTAYGAVDIAVEAMRLGARDFLTKPVTVEQVELRLKQIRPDLDQQAQDLENLPSFIAHSPASIRLMSAIKQAAEVPSPVLIEGEIGSGRGFAARTIHQLSDSTEPFRVWNVARDASWPENGTVLLPNVDDLPDDLQRHLVRNLHYLPENVRLIATSGPDGRQKWLMASCGQNIFFARSSGRRRSSSSGPPTGHITTPQSSDSTLQPRVRTCGSTINPQQQNNLIQHAWLGNVRELFNLGERAVVMGNNAFNFDVVKLKGKRWQRTPNRTRFNLSTYLEGIERNILEETLRRTHGDRNQAGRLLGVERNTLRYKLKIRFWTANVYASTNVIFQVMVGLILGWMSPCIWPPYAISYGCA